MQRHREEEMKVKVHIYNVDGTETYTEVTNFRTAFNWLNRYDHEGASLSLTIESESSAEVYELLERA